MKLAFLILCVIVLLYCVLVIIIKLINFILLFKQFTFLSKAFNLQYKALRPFIEEELTDRQILNELEQNQDAREILFFENELFIVFTRNGGGVVCGNTAQIRKNLVIAGCLIEKLKETLMEKNVCFYAGIYDENIELFRELRLICRSKGEPTHFEFESIKTDEEEYNR